MVEFLYILFWAVVCYFYAYRVKEELPGIDIKPDYYIISGFFFGFFSFVYCFFKRRSYIKHHNSND